MPPAGPTGLAIAEVMAHADRLQAAGEPDAAIALYRHWMTGADAPHRQIAGFNCGVLLGGLKRHEEAEQAYRQALAITPSFVEARLNLGHQLEHLGRVDEALEEWNRVREQALREPMSLAHRLHAINNMARLLEIERRFDEAERMMVQSLELSAGQPDVIQHYVHLRQKQCKWPAQQPVGDVSANQLVMGTSALATMALSDEPAAQLLSAYRFVADKTLRIVQPALHDANRRPGARVRIGYLSGDFCMHAMGLLIPELLELHDRSRFEVYGFCFSREDGSSLRERLIDGFDHHVRIHSLDDQQAAQAIAAARIDVLVDLHGLSSGARPGILARRPAPVQVGYLGLPATSALPGVDYMIADPFTMPPALQPWCTERPMLVPNCYQVSDRQRSVGTIPTRAACELAQDAFVFCSFNNSYKFTQPVFECWMRILAAVPGSVLWLLADNPWARENLCANAERHGIRRERLVFAPRVAPADYLARFAVADLFLDTFPYNAGATASDALWMGLPILTRSGNTYISRMAGSLLTNVGLPDLITTSIEDYESMAIMLARNPARIASYKRYLRTEGRQSRLFDIPRLVRDLEDGFEALLRTHHARVQPSQPGVGSRSGASSGDDVSSQPGASSQSESQAAG